MTQDCDVPRAFVCGLFIIRIIRDAIMSHATCSRRLLVCGSSVIRPFKSHMQMMLRLMLACDSARARHPSRCVFSVVRL